MNTKKVIWKTCIELRDDRVAKQVEVDKMINAYESGQESLIFRTELVSFVCAYGSIKRARPETVLN